jgi:very-short-patch-repair endonuclease
VTDAREFCPERRLSTPDLWIPTRGVRLPVHARDLRSRCIAHAITLPAGATFSHTTAAIAHALPLPSLGDEFVIHVTTPTGHRAPRRKDLVGHQRRLRDQDVVMVGGLRVTSLARTYIDLAEVLDLTALVAVGDRLLWRRAPKLDRDELRTAIAESMGRRGIAKATQALELLDDGAESPKESELRLLLRSAGFGPFASNFELFDARGDFVARIDLVLPGARIGIEYEGDHHRDRRQWRKDMARRRRIEALGWIYIPVTQADLDDPRTLLMDLSSALVARH